MENNESNSLAPVFDAYVDLMADILDLKIPPEMRPAVVENVERLRAIAQPLLDFELPDDIEPAPIFRP